MLMKQLTGGTVGGGEYKYESGSFTFVGPYTLVLPHKPKFLHITFVSGNTCTDRVLDDMHSLNSNPIMYTTLTNNAGNTWTGYGNNNPGMAWDGDKTVTIMTVTGTESNNTFYWFMLY